MKRKKRKKKKEKGVCSSSSASATSPGRGRKREEKEALNPARDKSRKEGGGLKEETAKQEEKPNRPTRGTEEESTQS